MLAVAAQAQSDAKALAIVQKSIEASGGKDKMMAIKTMIRKMEISMPFGTSESESYYKNGKFYMKSSMNGAVVMASPSALAIFLPSRIVIYIFPNKKDFALEFVCLGSD